MGHSRLHTSIFLGSLGSCLCPGWATDTGRGLSTDHLSPEEAPPADGPAGLPGLGADPSSFLLRSEWTQGALPVRGEEDGFPVGPPAGPSWSGLLGGSSAPRLGPSSACVSPAGGWLLGSGPLCSSSPGCGSQDPSSPSSPQLINQKARLPRDQSRSSPGPSRRESLRGAKALVRSADVRSSHNSGTPVRFIDWFGDKPENHFLLQIIFSLGKGLAIL